MASPLAYYPGCSLHGAASEFDVSMQAVARVLGMQLNEVPDWICCGSSPGHQASHALTLGLAATNLDRARGAGTTLVVQCAACYNNLRRSELEMRSSPEALADANEVAALRYDNSVTVRHTIDVLMNDVGLEAIKAKVTKPLTGLKVACYYGCLLTRPPEVAFDDPEQPSIMEKLMVALGAETVDYAFRTECCGAGMTLTSQDIMEDLSYKILKSAADAGADLMVCACPLCQPNLDMRQDAIRSRFGGPKALPILYFTQLMALAFGSTEAEVGLGKVFVDAVPVLKGKGLAV